LILFSTGYKERSMATKKKPAKKPTKKPVKRRPDGTDKPAKSGG
jgi:hypothetical protein